MTRARGWLAVGVMFALALTSTTAQDKTDSGQKAGEKRFSFAMENQPWSKVLEWLVDQTGLPLVSAQRSPEGNFSFVLPKIGGKPRTYTLPEIIDYVNDGLMTKGVMLVRREAALTLVPTDQPIDPALVPRVKVEELKSRGRTELVSVVVPLQVLQAKDILPDVKKLLGPFGEVVAFRNRILITDTAGNVRRTLGILTETDRVEPAAPPARPEPEAASGNIRTFTLEHGNAAMLADELHRLFKSLRDNPVRVVVPAGRGDGPQKKPLPKETKLPGTAPVTLTAVGNRLIVTSDDADALAAINELLRLVTQKTLQGPEVIPLRNASAMSVAKLLNETFNGPRETRKTERIRIIADPASNTLLVQASALDMITIRRLLDQALDVAGAEVVVRTRLLGPLRHATAAEVAKVVNALYANDNVVVAADSKTNTLVLRCSEPVYRDIEQMVRLLDTKEK